MVDLLQHLEKVALRRGFNGALDVVALHDVDDDRRRGAEDAEIEADLEEEPAEPLA